jgi:hypothetical protein
MTPDAIAKLLEEHFPTVDRESGYAWCACGYDLDFPAHEGDWAEHVGHLIAVGHAH